MAYISYLIGAVLGLVFGLMLSVSALWVAVFALTGLFAGFLASKMAKGSEKPYWFTLLALIVLIIAAFAGMAIPAPIMLAPIVFVVSYFLLRLISRFLPTPKAA